MKILSLFALALAAFAAPAAHAQPAAEFPTATVRLFVPFAAGGPTDVVARILAEQLSARWGGKPVVIENRPGAGTIIATAAVAKAPADGYTLLVTHAAIATAVALRSNSPFRLSELAAVSQLAAAPIARRIGLVRTMVYTHVPANVLLLLAALAPDLPSALACLLARSALSQIDVPARQALVMSVVPPEERSAAASVTNVPRSLATALAPLPAGWLLAQSDFGWPLVCAAVLKIVYDLLLLLRFGRIERSGSR